MHKSGIENPKITEEDECVVSTHDETTSSNKNVLHRIHQRLQIIVSSSDHETADLREIEDSFQAGDIPGTHDHPNEAADTNQMVDNLEDTIVPYSTAELVAEKRTDLIEQDYEDDIPEPDDTEIVPYPTENENNGKSEEVDNRVTVSQDDVNSSGDEDIIPIEEHPAFMKINDDRNANFELKMNKIFWEPCDENLVSISEKRSTLPAAHAPQDTRYMVI